MENFLRDGVIEQTETQDTAVPHYVYRGLFSVISHAGKEMLADEGMKDSIFPLFLFHLISSSYFPGLIQ